MNNLYTLYVKPLFDFTISLLLLIFFSWLLLIIGFVYILSFSFPIFFNQERIKQNNTPFLLYKFRTLKTQKELVIARTKDAAIPNLSAQIRERHAMTASSLEMPIQKRRFWFGDFLRATSLDELPQLLNVLKGEMSLIGPRPLPIEYLSLMSDEQKQRHQVKPGITGWAQVNGRNAITWQEKFELDNYYVKNISFLLDVKIIFKTIQLLLSFKKDISLNEKKFTGNDKA